MPIQCLIDCIEENDNITNNPTIMTLDTDVTTPHTKSLTIEEGIAAAKLFEAAKIPELTDNDIIVTSARQYDALVHAEDNLSRVLEGLETNLSGDLIAEDLRLVLSDLAEITGDKGIIQSQEVLNNIFQHFCKFCRSKS